jgi:O-antigen/teichoic acid export membrane protein
MTGAGIPEARRQVLGGQVVIAVSEAIRFALLLWLTRLLQRHLSIEDFGFVTIVPAIYLVAHTLLDLGTGALVAREAARRPERERPLLEAAVAVRGIGGGLLGLLVAAFALAEPDPGRRTWLFVTALTLPALAPAVLGAAFRVRQDQVSPAAISIVTIALMLAVTMICVEAGAPGPVFAVIYVLREVVNGVALWLVGRARHGLVIAPGLAGRDAAAFFRAAAPQNVAVVFQIASLNLGVFGLRFALGEEELGAYAAAWRLVGPLLLLVGALVAPLLPLLAQAHRDPAAFARTVMPALWIGAGVGALGAAFLVVAGADALRLIYGSESVASGPHSATGSLITLGFVFAAVCVGAVGTTALLCLDRERQLRAIAIVALVLNAAVFAATARLIGRVAAAAGLLAAELWTAAASLVVLRRALREPVA